MKLSDIGSALRIENLFFEKCSFIRNKGKIESDELNLGFQRHTEELDKDFYEVKLTMTIQNTSSDFEIEVVLVAELSVTGDDEAFKRELIQKNAVAVLFPYIRSQVSILTAQPGFTPIDLPPINIVKLLEQSETAN